MARPRNFSEDEVLVQAAAIFARLGYDATSIDDLLAATGLQRGSLYKAFGSKRNLFEKVLAGALAPGWTSNPASIDLLIIALKELVPDDPPIAALCRRAVEEAGTDAARLLGARLLEHLD
ncbi:TetR/AcrR family transcriptional regulator [Massilia sp. Leaf139]|uniref:TetR/AcrR family transcriptional regulator n=1 Tax=Massilia sp. Leaf139 TaxID=1736272 RepID=UPI0006F45E56|nr:helix-turn-helix domain-containing protein [Massilia sp. Leaf139]KQQ87936.1 TetR family transcriptional regulator [Massilia sp. Leaf139]